MHLNHEHTLHCTYIETDHLDSYKNTNKHHWTIVNR